MQAFLSRIREYLSGRFVFHAFFALVVSALLFTVWSWFAAGVPDAKLVATYEDCVIVKAEDGETDIYAALCPLKASANWNDADGTPRTFITDNH